MQYTRRSTGLPTEIWHNCWSYLPKPDLITVSMTCRLFHDICRPQVFQKLEYISAGRIGYLYHQGSSNEEYEEWGREAARFEEKLKWLASDPIRARYPRYCNFDGFAQWEAHLSNSTHPKQAKVFDSLFSTFKTSLASFPNLRSLKIANLEMDEEYVRVIGKMPLLKCMHLDGVDFSYTSHFPLIHLPELHISEQKPPLSFVGELHVVKPFQLFSNQGLEIADIELYDHALPCLRHFISQGTSKALTTLRILLNIDIIHTLFAFLETCPNLTTFVATTDQFESNLFNNPTFPSLSSSALPKLCSYEGPASLAVVLIPGRPVDSIILTDSCQWPRNNDDVQHSSTLHELTKSSVIVKLLVLPFMKTLESIFYDVLKMFPSVETLQFTFIPSPADRVDFELGDEALAPNEEYFDLTLPTEINSIPVNENGCPTRPPTTLRGIIYWLCLNKLPLPSTIKHLSIHNDTDCHGEFYLSYREQHHALRMLADHFPGLRSMSFGVPRVRWVRNDCGEWVADRRYKWLLEYRHRKKLLKTGMSN